MDTKWKKKGSGKWIYFGFTLIPVAQIGRAHV